MANVILIENDPKLERQIKGFLEEQGDEHRIRVFPSAQNFVDRYFAQARHEGKVEGEEEKKVPEENPPASDAENAEDDEEFKILSQIDLIIVKLNMMGPKPVQWIDQVQKSLKVGGYWPPGNRTRLMILKYEDDNILKSSLLHPMLDDILFVPLDRLICLQKIDIVLTLPKKASPRFLFNQDVVMDVEISKRSNIELLSDVGFAVRNPVPLKAGLLGHFYFRFLPSEPWMRVHGKVVKSERHPKAPKEFLVYFSFFGLQKDASMAVRRYLTSRAGHKNFVDTDPASFVFNADNIFLTADEKRKKTVVVLDLDPEVLSTVKSSIEEDVAHTQVLTERSYSNFLFKYLGGDSANPLTDAKPASLADFYSESAQWIVDLESQNLIKALNPPPPDAATPNLFGFPASDLFAQPQSWMKPFSTDEGKALLKEAFEVVKSGFPFQSEVSVKTQEGEWRRVAMEVTLGPSAEQAQITLRPPELDVATINQIEQIESLDLLIIDEALVPQDVASWLEGLKAACTKKGIAVSQDGLPVVVMASPKRTSSFARLRDAPIKVLLLKPLDRRSLLISAVQCLKSPFSIHRFENIYWQDEMIPVNVAKPVVLEKISEYGATFRHPKPIAVGTALFFHGAIFDKAPEGNLLCKVYACEEHPSNKDEILVSVIYFGINDQFLKFTRSYIRELHASRKQEAG